MPSTSLRQLFTLCRLLLCGVLPKDVLARINAETARVMALPDVREKLD